MAIGVVGKILIGRCEIHRGHKVGAHTIAVCYHRFYQHPCLYHTHVCVRPDTADHHPRDFLTIC